jgi:hypothetical protein
VLSTTILHFAVLCGVVWQIVVLTSAEFAECSTCRRRATEGAKEGEKKGGGEHGNFNCGTTDSVCNSSSSSSSLLSQAPSPRVIHAQRLHASGAGGVGGVGVEEWCAECGAPWGAPFESATTLHCYVLYPRRLGSQPSSLLSSSAAASAAAAATEGPEEEAEEEVVVSKVCVRKVDGAYTGTGDATAALMLGWVHLLLSQGAAATATPTGGADPIHTALLHALATVKVRVGVGLGCALLCFAVLCCALLRCTFLL